MSTIGIVTETLVNAIQTLANIIETNFSLLSASVTI